MDNPSTTSAGATRVCAADVLEHICIARWGDDASTSARGLGGGDGFGRGLRAAENGVPYVVDVKGNFSVRRRVSSKRRQYAAIHLVVGIVMRLETSKGGLRRDHGGSSSWFLLHRITDVW